MIKHILLSGFVLTMVMACSHTGSVNIKKDYQFSEAEEVGLLIGSASESLLKGESADSRSMYFMYTEAGRYAGTITTEKPDIDKSALQEVGDFGLTMLIAIPVVILSGGHVPPGNIDTYRSKLEVTPTSESSKGYVFVMKMPPGKYQIKRWSIKDGPVKDEEKLTPLEFEIVKGQATYIGNLHMNYLRTSSAFFSQYDKRIDEAQPEIRDESRRDIDLFRGYFKNLKDIAISKQLMVLGPWL